MDKLRILFTNNTLRHRAGSEMVVLDLTKQLRKMGHLPVAYSSDLGPVAEDLKRNCIPVLNDLRDLGFVPDVIHGQHHLDAMTAMLHFPETPAVYVCHGWIPWEETPPVFPNIQRYIAVSELTAEKLRTTNGVAADQISIVRNAIDLDRFRKKLIAPVPLSAAIFSNYVGAGPFQDLVRGACKKSGIDTLDVIGGRSGNAVRNPEDVLVNYDLVFAIGRSALEAMATGCAVIVASPDGLAGMVDQNNVEDWSKHNFALAILDPVRLSEQCLVEEIRKYRPGAIEATSDHIRRHNSLDQAAGHYLTLYREAIARWAEGDRKSAGFRKTQWLSLSRYLANISARVKGAQSLHRQLANSEAELSVLRAEILSLKKDMAAAQAQSDRPHGNL